MIKYLYKKFLDREYTQLKSLKDVYVNFQNIHSHFSKYHKFVLNNCYLRFSTLPIKHILNQGVLAIQRVCSLFGIEIDYCGIHWNDCKIATSTAVPKQELSKETYNEI